jgi:hypothetical protein
MALKNIHVKNERQKYKLLFIYSPMVALRTTTFNLLKPSGNFIYHQV